MRKTDSAIDKIVIEELRPQERRYDVAVSDELVLAVLPNGVKTWTWVYDGPAKQHRQTLGVYPDMSFDQARKAQRAAAKRRRRGDRNPRSDYVIRGGRIQKAGFRRQWPVLGILGALVAGTLLGWLMLGEDNSDDAAVADTVASPRTGAPAPRQSPTDPRAADDRTPVVTANTSGPQMPPPAAQLQVSSSQPAEQTAIDLRAEPENADRFAQPNEAQRVAGETTRQPTEGAAYADSNPTPVPPAPPPARQMTEPDPATATEFVGAPGVANTAMAPVTAQIVSHEADTGRIQPATESPPAVDTAIQALETIQAPTDFEPGITDSRVPRAQITSAVVDREPVDSLGPVVLGNGQDMQTYYFFTELRSLQGQQVRHRWIAGDRVQADVPFDVGGAWRWRIYSSKRLLAGLAGEWRVQVVLEDGTVIHDYPFQFEP